MCLSKNRISFDRVLQFFDGMLQFVICIITIIAVYLFVQLAFMISVWGDVERMIAGSFLLMTNTGNAYKMMVLLVRHDRIRSLVEVVDGEIFSRYNVFHERIMSSYTWRGIIHHATYQSLGGVSICCWTLASVIDIAKNGERRLPVESWYPYNVTKSPNFELTCVQQILGEMILCCHNVALDTLVTNFMCVACCQLEILKRNVRTIGDDNDDPKAGDPESENAKWNEKAHEKLKSCVQHNKAIIYFKKEIQEIFGTSILFQCFVNCAIICLTAFHLSRMSEFVPAEILGTVLYLCGMVFQIFIYCWHGNELALHSESVCLAAYSGQWWRFDKSYRSTLRILMIRSRRPLVLTAGKIMILSLETFTSILRMSYSLFTVLQSSTTNDD